MASLRGMDRWGCGEMANKAYTGFVALERLPGWREVLGYEGVDDLRTVKELWRRLRSEYHPDKGKGGVGCHEMFCKINAAYAEAEKEFGA